jgi:hypothetical protein
MDVKLSLLYAISYPIEAHVDGLGVLLFYGHAVELTVCTDVAGCRYPIS